MPSLRTYNASGQTPLDLYLAFFLSLHIPPHRRICQLGLHLSFNFMEFLELLKTVLLEQSWIPASFDSQSFGVLPKPILAACDLSNWQCFLKIPMLCYTTNSSYEESNLFDHYSPWVNYLVRDFFFQLFKVYFAFSLGYRHKLCITYSLYLYSLCLPSYLFSLC